MKIERREFLLGMGAAALAGCVMDRAGGGAPGDRPLPGAPEWYSFSRVFQKFGMEKAADLLARAGYTGVEWTVRKGGFVEPARAAAELPKAMKVARAAGLKAEMVVMDFTDPNDPVAREAMKVAADQGVKSFRTGYFFYDPKANVHDELKRIRKGFAALVKTAEETGLRFTYQNHSTYRPGLAIFGSLMWDLWEVAKDFDPKHLGVQYDPMHAEAEAGPTSWHHSLGLLAPWISAVCLKDFWFEPDGKNPKLWRRRLCPAGEGIVPWAKLKALQRQYRVAAPYTIHYDYDFPETDYARAFECAKKDLDFFKGALA